MHNKHDTCIREVLTNKKEIALLINKTLKLKDENQITEGMLKRCDNRFITQSYYNKETDLIYKLKDKNVYILIEHQSTSDKYMAKRIAEYQTEIIRRHEKDKIVNKKDKLPLVIPIVIYTGNRKCNMKNSILELQEKMLGYENKNLGEYILVDINKSSEKNLLNEKGAFSKIILLDKAKNKEELERIYKIINKSKLSNDEKIEIEKYTCNIASNTFKAEYIVQLREKYKVNEGGKGMLVETLKREIRREKKIARLEGHREGKEKGIREGMKKGEVLGMKTVAKGMIRENIDIEIIKRCTNLSDKELNKIKSEKN